MIIKKKGNKFVAYFTEESEFTNPNCKIGDSSGEISITTGKFVGGTKFMTELHKHLEEYLKPQKEKYEQLIDRVIEQVKKDVADGDVTVIDELLRLIPTENLIQSLPEEEWDNYKS